MNKKKINAILKLVVKLSLTSGALIFVFRKIDVDEFKDSILDTSIPLFFLAFLAFNLSKIVAAVRFKQFLRPLEIYLEDKYNLMLSYVGMFYNLFLPGSIGGDGYKVFVLKQQYKEAKTRHLVSVSILDRVSGLAFLFILGCLLLLSSTFQVDIPWIQWVILTLAILVLPVYYLFIKVLFPVFKSAFIPTSHLSFWVQIGQLTSAFCLLLALNIQDPFVDYLTLFMISSVVAVLPFTIGGVGARELVFLYGYQYLQIQEGKAIAFTILFFMVTALSSLVGLPFVFTIDREKKEQQPEEV
ncbi:MAG: flippase-like domain-containing protein [Cyclobacteriaceae bacterium]|nr:flippase-like domain-containing protein [Cyclobacteriaceae bacterium SS2]